MNIKELLFTINGRIGRKTYWFVYLPILAVSILYIVFANILICSVENEDTEVILGVLSFVSILGCVINSILGIICIAPTIKRLHDVDKSGWFLLVLCIPIVGLWVLYLLFFKKGTEGKNRFGNAPQN